MIEISAKCKTCHYYKNDFYNCQGDPNGCHEYVKNIIDDKLSVPTPCVIESQAEYEELKPCPFCGLKAGIWQNKDKSWFINCKIFLKI